MTSTKTVCYGLLWDRLVLLGWDGSLVCTVRLGYMSLLFGAMAFSPYISFGSKIWNESILSLPVLILNIILSCFEVAAKSWALLYCFSIFRSAERPNLLPVFCVNESDYVIFVGIHFLWFAPYPVKVTNILMLLIYPFFAV